MKVALLVLALCAGAASAAIFKDSTGIYASQTTWDNQLHYTYAVGAPPVRNDYRNPDLFMKDASGASPDDLIMLFRQTKVKSGTHIYCEIGSGKSYPNWYAQYDDVGANKGDWVWNEDASFTVGKYFMCVCSAAGQATVGDDCDYAGGANSASLDDYDFHFDKSPGYLHVVDAESLTYVAGENQGLWFQHYTVLGDWESLDDPQQLSIAFTPESNGTPTISNSDDYYFALWTSENDRCAEAPEDIGMFGGSFLGKSALLEIDDYMVFPTLGFGQTAAGSPTELTSGKAMICFCDRSYEGGICPTFDTNHPNPKQYYGAQIGFIHVIMTSSFEHVTLPYTDGSDGSVTISLSFDVVENAASSASFVGDVSQGLIGAAGIFGSFGSCGTASGELGPEFLDGEHRASALSWERNLAKTSLFVHLDNTEGTQFGSARVCYCDRSAEGQACDEVEDADTEGHVGANAHLYGAQWGWIHKINVERVGLHYTVRKSDVDMDIVIEFIDDTPDDATFTPDATSGLSSADDRFMVSTDCGNDGEHTMYVDGVSDVPAYDAKEGDLTIQVDGVAVGKVELCYCDWESHHDDYTGSGAEACDPAYGVHWAHIGYVHVVDMEFTMQHVSIAKGSDTGTSEGVIELFFNHGFASDSDKIRLVSQGDDCGWDSPNEVLVDLDDAIAAVVYEENAAEQEILQFSGVGISSAEVDEDGKLVMCLCDASVEGACTENNDYGATVGFLHVVDIEIIPVHYTIGIGRTAISEQFISTTFLSDPDPYEDNFYLADTYGTQFCANVEPKGEPFDVETQTLTMSGTVLTVAVDRNAGESDLENLGIEGIDKLVLCFCDADTEGDGACDETTEDFVEHGGAWIGYVHVLDQSVSGHLHWTLATIPDQTLSVQFQGVEDSAQASDRLMAVAPGEGGCGYASSDADVLANDLATMSSEHYSTNEDENVLMLSGIDEPAKAGKLKLCFCDASVETDRWGNAVACDKVGESQNFGAWLGYLHVVRAQSVNRHHTIAINSHHAADDAFAQITVSFDEGVDGDGVEDDGSGYTLDGFTVVPIEVYSEGEGVDFNAGSCGTYEIEDLPNNKERDDNQSEGKGFPGYSTISAPMVAGDGNDVVLDMVSKGRDITALCFCDHSVEAEYLSVADPYATSTFKCGGDRTSADGRTLRAPIEVDRYFDTHTFGAQVGVVHSVPMTTTSYHSTILAGVEDSNFYVLFDDYYAVPYCYAASDYDTVLADQACDGFDQNRLRLIAMDDVEGCGGDGEAITIGGVDISTHDDYELVPSGTNGLKTVFHHPLSFEWMEDECADSTDADCKQRNPEVALELANPVTVEKLSKETCGDETCNQVTYKMCFCDYNLEGESCETPNNFGAQVGYLHVIDAPQKSYTLAVGDNDPVLEVAFGDTSNPTEDYRAMLVDRREYCGFWNENANVESTEDLDLAGSIKELSPDRGTDDFGFVSLSWDLGQLTGIGKARVCLCDYMDGSCDSESDFGTEMGWLHVVDIEATGLSYTLPLQLGTGEDAVGDDLIVEFNNYLIPTYDANPQQDNLMVVGFERECGYNEYEADLLSVDASTYAERLSANHKALAFPDLSATDVGRARLCFCDAGSSTADGLNYESEDAANIEISSRQELDVNGGDASCQPEVHYFHFGASLGAVYVIDVAALPLQYTIARNTDQKIEVVFQNSQTEDKYVEDVDRLFSVALTSACGNGQASTTYVSDLSAATVTTTVEHEDTLTVVGMSGTAVGIQNLCFCDASVVGECDSFDDFGAQLGQLHVLDVEMVPVHVSVVSNRNENDHQGFTIKFLTSQGAESSDRFKIVNYEHDCNLGDLDTTLMSEEDIGQEPDWDSSKKELELSFLRISDATSGNSVISKRKLCFCDNSAEKANNNCEGFQGAGYAENYGAHMGWIHVVATADFENLGKHYSIARQENQDVVVSFDDLNSDNPEDSRFTFSENCGHDFVSENFDGFALANTVPEVDGEDSIVNTGTNVGVAPARYKLCYCHYDVEDYNNEGAGCGRGGESGDEPEARYFGVEIGFLHIVDVETVYMHWTIANDDTQTLSVEFLTPYDASKTVTDRFRLAESNDDCGSTLSFNDFIDTIFEDVPAVDAEDNHWLTLDDVHGFRVGKSTLCFCDSGVEGFKGACNYDEGVYGALLGQVHVVDLVLNPPIHITIPNANNQELRVNFQNDQQASTSDRFMAVDTAFPCATAGQDASLFDPIGSQAPELAEFSQYDWLVVDDVDPAEVGKARLCFCDHSVEGSCSTSTAEGFGADLGFVHVVDVLETGDHWTFAAAADQHVSITFATSAPDADDTVSAVSTTEGCGKNAEVTFVQSLRDHANVEYTVDGETLTFAVDASAATAGKALLCLCDHSVEGQCASYRDFGGELGFVHVLDLSDSPLHFTTSNGVMDSFDLVFNGEASENDDYKLVASDDDCHSGAEVTYPATSSVSGSTVTWSVNNEEGVAVNLKICMCDSNAEGGCNEKTDSDGLPTSDYGALVGYLHVADIADEVRHITIKNLYGQEIPVTFTVDADGNDLFQTVDADDQCASGQEMEHAVKLSAATADGSVLTVTTDSMDEMNVGETRLCMCDNSIADNACEADSDFGAQVAVLHVCEALIYASVGSSTVRAGVATTLSVKFELPMEHSVTAGAILELVFPSGWTYGNDYAASQLRACDETGACTSVGFTEVSSEEEAFGDRTDVHDKCNSGRVCVDLTLTGAINGGSHVYFQVSGATNPEVGATSNDAELILYRSNSEPKDIIETFIDALPFPNPMDATDVYGTTIELSNIVKGATGVEATITFQPTLEVAKDSQVALRLPEGFSTGASAAISVAEGAVYSFSAPTSAQEDAASGLWEVKFKSTSVLSPDNVYTLVLHDVANRELSYYDEGLPNSSAELRLFNNEVDEGTGDYTLLQIQNQNIFVQELLDEISVFSWYLDVSIAGSSGVVAEVSFEIPEWVQTFNGYVRMTLPDGWQVAEDDLTVVQHFDDGSTLTNDGFDVRTADNQIEWDYNVESSGKVTFSIHTLQVGTTVGNTDAVAIEFFERGGQRTTADCPNKSCYSHVWGDFVVTRQLAATFPPVTAEASDLTILYYHTVAEHATSGEIAMTLPAELGLADNVGIAANDKFTYTFPLPNSGAWLTADFVETTVNLCVDDACADVDITTDLSAQSFSFTFPSDVAPGSNILVSVGGLTIPALGADFDGAKVAIDQLQDDGRFTTISGDLDKETPQVTAKISSASVSLSNQRANLVPDETHTNEATVTFESPVAIDGGSIILFSFPNAAQPDTIVAASTTVTVNYAGAEESADRLNSVDFLPYSEDEASFIDGGSFPHKVAFKTTQLIPAGTVTFRVGGVTNPDAGEQYGDSHIEVYTEQQTDKWVLITEILQTGTSEVAYDAIFASLDSAYFVPSTHSGSTAGASIRVAFKLPTDPELALATGMTVVTKFPSEWGATNIESVSVDSIDPTLQGKEIIDGQVFVSWQVTSESGSTVVFDILGVTLPAAGVEASTSAWIQVKNNDGSKVYSDALDLPVNAIEGPITDGVVQLADTRVGASGTDVTVSFTSPVDIPLDAKIKLTLPDEWDSAFITGGTVTVSAANRGEETTAAWCLTGMCLCSSGVCPVILSLGGQPIVAGESITITLAGAGVVPDNVLLTMDLALNQVLAVFTTPLVDDYADEFHSVLTDTKATDGFGDYLFWHPVAAHIEPESDEAGDGLPTGIRYHFDHTVEPDPAAETPQDPSVGKIEFYVPPELAIGDSDEIEVTFPTGWDSVHSNSETKWCGTRTTGVVECPNWPFDDIEGTDGSKQISADLIISNAAFDAETRVHSWTVSNLGGAQEVYGDIFKWTVSGIDIPYAANAGEDSQLRVYHMQNDARGQPRRTLSAIGEQKFPNVAWRLDTAKVEMSAYGLGAEEVTATVTFTNYPTDAHVGEEGTVAVFFPPEYEFVGTRTALKWFEPVQAAVNATGRIVPTDDGSAVYEVNLGKVSQSGIDNNAPVRFEIRNALKVKSLTPTNADYYSTVTNRLQTKEAGQTVIAEDTDVDFHPTGTAVDYLYGRISNLALAATADWLEVAFAPQTALVTSGTAGSNSQVFIQASKNIFNTADREGVAISYKTEDANNIYVDSCGGASLRFDSESHVTITMPAGTGNTCIPSNTPVAFVLTNALKANPISATTVTFQVRTTADQELQEAQGTGYTVGSKLRLTIASTLGAKQMKFQFDTDCTLPTDTPITLSIDASHWVFNNSVQFYTDMAHSSLAVTPSNRRNGFGKHVDITFTSTQDALEAQKDYAFLLKNTNNDGTAVAPNLVSGTPVQFSMTATYSEGRAGCAATNNLHLGDYIGGSSLNRAQGYVIGQRVDVLSVTTSNGKPGETPESKKVVISGTIGGKGTIVFSSGFSIGSGRRLLAPTQAGECWGADEWAFTGSLAHCSQSLMSGSTLCLLDGNTVEFTVDPDCVQGAGDAGIEIIGGHNPNPEEGEVEVVVVQLEGGGSANILPEAESEALANAIQSATDTDTGIINSNDLLDLQPAAFAQFGTSVTEVKASVANAAAVEFPGKMFLSFKTSDTGSLQALSVIHIQASQKLFVTGVSPRVTLDEQDFIGCVGKASAKTNDKLEITLFGDACAADASRELNLSLENSGSNIALFKNPIAGVTVNFKIWTTSDLNVGEFTPTYTTFGFEHLKVLGSVASQIAVDATKTTDTSFTFRVKVQVPDEVNHPIASIQCIAVAGAGGDQPTAAQVLAGQNSGGGAADSVSAVLALADNTVGELTLAGLNDATPYTLVCAARVTNEANQEVSVRSLALANQGTLGFNGIPTVHPNNVVKVDEYIITARVARDSMVTCIAVTSGSAAPLAANILAGTAAGIYANDDAGRSTQVLQLSKTDVEFKFKGLTEATRYAAYCAIAAPQIISDAYPFVTPGFSIHPREADSPKTTHDTCYTFAQIAKSQEVRCVAVNRGAAAPSSAQIMTNTPALASASHPAVQTAVTEDATTKFYSFATTFAGLSPKSSYDIYCSTKSGVVSRPAVCNTVGYSGIAGDPHVFGSDGEYVDFYGQAGVYNVFESESMAITGRFAAASAGDRMLFHPNVMKAGTVMKEAGIAIGDVRLRVATVAGGMVSIVDPVAPTSFLTTAEAQTLTIGDVTVQWTPVTKTVAKPWGAHSYSAQLTLKSGSETVNMFVAESKGYHFVDIDASAAAAPGTGLLNQAMEQPAALATVLKAQREAAFLVDGASGDLFPQLECGNNAQLGL